MQKSLSFLRKSVVKNAKQVSVRAYFERSKFINKGPWLGSEVNITTAKGRGISQQFVSASTVIYETCQASFEAPVILMSIKQYVVINVRDQG